MFTLIDPYLVRRIHHLTKYASISNYHSMNELAVEGFDSQNVFGFEKVDGTGVRIVLHFDDNKKLRDFFIGSRGTILYAFGDRNFVPELDIVLKIQRLFPDLFSDLVSPIPAICDSSCLMVIYGELFGHGIGSAAGNYANGRELNGFRVFDVAKIKLPDMSEPFDPQQLGDYRDQNIQFQDVHYLMELKGVDTVPLVFSGSGDQLPKTPLETKEWVQNFSDLTCCGLDGFYGAPSEGIVVRNFNRSVIAKIRHQNYKNVPGV